MAWHPANEAQQRKTDRRAINGLTYKQEVGVGAFVLVGVAVFLIGMFYLTGRSLGHQRTPRGRAVRERRRSETGRPGARVRRQEGQSRARGARAGEERCA